MGSHPGSPIAQVIMTANQSMLRPWTHPKTRQLNAGGWQPAMPRTLVGCHCGSIAMRSWKRRSDFWTSLRAQKDKSQKNLAPPEVDCSICNGARWVCEAHPSLPWGSEDGCTCGAPGMPCSVYWRRPSRLDSSGGFPSGVFLHRTSERRAAQRIDNAAYRGRETPNSSRSKPEPRRLFTSWRGSRK